MRDQARRLAEYEDRFYHLGSGSFDPSCVLGVDIGPDVSPESQIALAANSSTNGPSLMHQLFDPPGETDHYHSSGASHRYEEEWSNAPPDDVVAELITLFFDHIHPWVPLLSRSQLVLTRPWPVSIWAIIVITLRMSDDPRVVRSRSQWKETAKQQVLSKALETTSIASVQALALLTVDLIGSKGGPPSWPILALLTRSAVHLDLAFESDADIAPSERRPRSPSHATHSLNRTRILAQPRDWQDDEARRRLFWLIFSLDRYACISTGWQFALPDLNIERRLPCADHLWADTVSPARLRSTISSRPLTLSQKWQSAPYFQPLLHHEGSPDPSVISPFSHLIEIMDLLGRVHTLHCQKLDPQDVRGVQLRKDQTLTLTCAARRWYSNLPLRQGSQDALSLMTVSLPLAIPPPLAGRALRFVARHLSRVCAFTCSLLIAC